MFTIFHLFQLLGAVIGIMVCAAIGLKWPGLILGGIIGYVVLGGVPLVMVGGVLNRRRNTYSQDDEFGRAVDIQRAYWTYNPEEQQQLEARGFEDLNWRERLRLHHLYCLQCTQNSSASDTTRKQRSNSGCQLLEANSPYRPRSASIWQRQSSARENRSDPDMVGEFLNPSLTHLGCLEIYRLDDANQVIGIDFISFGELTGVGFGPPSLIRPAKLFYVNGSSELVLVPLLYGLTWAIGDEYSRTGRMTNFVSFVDSEPLAAIGASGIGVGQQDFCLKNHDGTASLFGLGSVAQISFPLDILTLKTARTRDQT